MNKQNFGAIKYKIKDIKIQQVMKHKGYSQ